MTTVALHCAQPVLTAGFQAVLAKLDGFELSAVCSHAPALMEHLRTHHPHVLLIDLTAEITLDLLRQIRSDAPGTAVILWVDGVSTEFASQAIALGVRGVLRKSLAMDLQAKCVRVVAGGELWVEKSLSEQLLSARRISLTTRERQLVGLIAQGLKNKEIAYSLGVTEGTVKVYLSRLFQKVGANDRFELALFALKNLAITQGPDTAATTLSPQDSAATAIFVPSFMSIDHSRA